MTDGKIIELYFSRDESAISATAEKYGAYLGKIAYNILSDEFESEECVNDTYMRAWTKIPPEVPRIFSAFLARITRNLSLDRMRARSAEKRAAYDGIESLDELSECVGGGECDLDSREIAVVINSFLCGLPEADRRMFVLRYFHEQPVSDVARSLGKSESAVKVRLFRLRGMLREKLIKEGLFD